MGRLSGVEFDDELLVGDRIDLIADRRTIDGAFHGIAIDGQPVTDRIAKCHFEETTDKLLGFRAVFDGDDVTCLGLEAGDVDDLTVHSDVTMADELAGSEACVSETHAIDDVVEAQLQHLEEVFTGHTFTALSFSKETAELLFKDAILETQFLLFNQSDAVIGHLAACIADAVLPWWEVAEFKSFGGTEKGDAEAACNLFAGTCVTCHKGKLKRG